MDKDRIDEAALRLLYLTLHDECLAWKTFDWDTMNRLHSKGLISDPRNRSKSIAFSEDGLAAARLAFGTMFEGEA